MFNGTNLNLNSDMDQDSLKPPSCDMSISNAFTFQIWVNSSYNIGIYISCGPPYFKLGYMQLFYEPPFRCYKLDLYIWLWIKEVHC